MKRPAAMLALLVPALAAADDDRGAAKHAELVAAMAKRACVPPIKIVDDDGNELPAGTEGKLYFEEKRSPRDQRELGVAKQLDPRDPTPWFYDAIAKGVMTVSYAFVIRFGVQIVEVMLPVPPAAESIAASAAAALAAIRRS